MAVTIAVGGLVGARDQARVTRDVLGTAEALDVGEDCDGGERDDWADAGDRLEPADIITESVPQLGKKTQQRLESIKGMVPDPYNIPPGCAFHPRCPYFKPGICDEPDFRQVGENHWVRCSRAEELHLAAIEPAR